MAEAPTSLVERAIGQHVSLLLKDGRTLSGRLLGVDEHMNVVLDDAEETTPELTRRLGRLVLRGSNVTSLHAPSAGPSKNP